MLKLYVADISKLPDPLLYPDIMQKIPLERQQRIQNMKQEKSRKQSIGAGLLLQKVLALYHMEQSPVVTGEHGKPMVAGLKFNLSHSGDLVICAVSNQPVGCDVEKIRKAPESVAERYFSCGEREYLNQFHGEDYDTAFFRLWTMKESYVKMTGEGMSLPRGEYEVVAGEPARALRGGEFQECYLREIELDGYLISICSQDCAHVEVFRENL